MDFSYPTFLKLLYNKRRKSAIENKKRGRKTPSLSTLVDVLPDDLVLRAEDQRDAPDTGQSHHGEDDACEQRSGAPTDPRHRIETEKADRAPVQRADDNKDQGDPIQDHHAFVPHFRETKTLPVH